VHPCHYDIAAAPQSSSLKRENGQTTRSQNVGPQLDSSTKNCPIEWKEKETRANEESRDNNEIVVKTNRAIKEWDDGSTRQYLLNINS